MPVEIWGGEKFRLWEERAELSDPRMLVTLITKPGQCVYLKIHHHTSLKSDLD
jgi:hypothetical protein